MKAFETLLPEVVFRSGEVADLHGPGIVLLSHKDLAHGRGALLRSGQGKHTLGTGPSGFVWSDGGLVGGGMDSSQAV